MKKTFIFTVLAATTVALTCSCQKENQTSSKSVEVSFNAESISSKTAISDAGAVTWTTSDALSVFTDTEASTNVKFTASEIAEGGKSATFTGSVASNPARTSFTAIYPYSAVYTSAAGAVSIPTLQTAGQESAIALMAGKGNVNGDDFTCSIQMEHLCWIYDVTIANPGAKQIRKVTFSADEKLFTTEGTLTADLTIEPTATTSAISVAFPTAMTAASVNARFVLFPLSCTSKDFTVEVEFEDGKFEDFNLEGKNIAAAAGSRYSNSFILGQGESSDCPAGFTFVPAGSNIATAIASAISEKDEVKLWLESSPTESKAFSTTSRINPQKPLTICADPNNMKPTITIGAAAAITPKNDVESIYFENIIFKQSDSGAGDFIYFDTGNGSGSNTIGSLTIRNCEFTNFKYSLIRTSSLTNGMGIGSIVFDNSIWTSKSSFDGGRAWIHLVNNKDRMPSIAIMNSTILVNFCLIYCNINSSAGIDIDYTVRNCTFGNGKNTSSSNNYFMNIASGTLHGNVAIAKCLFGGSFTLKSGLTTFLPVREGSDTNFVNTFTDNYYTESWHNGWTMDLNSKNYLFDFLTTESTSDNDALVPGYSSGNFTVTPGTDVYVNGIGDPRWIK